MGISRHGCFSAQAVRSKECRDRGAPEEVINPVTVKV